MGGVPCLMCYRNIHAFQRDGEWYHQYPDGLTYPCTSPGPDKPEQVSGPHFPAPVNEEEDKKTLRLVRITERIREHIFYGPERESAALRQWREETYG
jgi:hypothetical protein